MIATDWKRTTKDVMVPNFIFSRIYEEREKNLDMEEGRAVERPLADRIHKHGLGIGRAFAI